jgi:hypothetical protein
VDVLWFISIISLLNVVMYAEAMRLPEHRAAARSMLWAVALDRLRRARTRWRLLLVR